LKLDIQLDLPANAKIDLHIHVCPETNNPTITFESPNKVDILQKVQNDPKEIGHNIVIPQAKRAIYGTDDRKEVASIQDYEIKQNIKAVAGIVDAAYLVDQGNGRTLIQAPNLADRILQKHGKTLSDRTKYANQTTAAFQGSCFLIAPDIIATADHCFRGVDLNTHRIVFNYEVSGFGVAPIDVFTSSVYEAVEILDNENINSDWAIIRLNRVVTGVRPVNLSTLPKAPDNADIYVIGHPIGLPKKYADNANIANNHPNHHFSCNLDTFGGNSGSPVFNAKSHEVEGILVRGAPDFVSTDGVVEFATYDQSDNKEECSRIQPVVFALSNLKQNYV